MAAPIRHNPDGTVDLASLKNHVAHLKGKYAQNAKNYERNTGHKLTFGSDEGASQSKDEGSTEDNFPAVQQRTAETAADAEERTADSKS